MTSRERLKAATKFYVAVVFAIAAVGCEEQEISTSLEKDDGVLRIINGSSPVDAAWDGVGALTLTYPGYGYAGSFCTGTLIAPNWVLTAAHCLTEHNQINLQPKHVKFFIGSDANNPNGGTLYAAGAFHIHPDYDHNSITKHDDIALLSLTQTVAGVPTYPINQTDLDILSPASGFYVGFGLYSVSNQNSGGVKRSATIPIQSIGAMSYTNSSGSKAVCFGDSGGPGFYKVGTEWRVIGVNSTTFGETCGNGSTQMRVDRYAQWIAQTMGDSPPSCKTNPSLCLCDDACQANGMCDNSACETMNCSQVYNCTTLCGTDTSCQDECYFSGTSAAKTAFDDMMYCFYQNCQNAATDADYIKCVRKYCVTTTNNCFKPSNCDLLGGDCSGGEACTPILLIGKNTCLPSNQKDLGDECDPTLWDENDCKDGMFCAGYFGSGNCYNTCRAKTDCESGEICSIVFDFGDEPAICLESAGDADTDVDTDVDTDTDTDGDTDTDTDADTDADTAGDADSDGDVDADSDGDSDADGDSTSSRSEGDSCQCQAPGHARPHSREILLFRIVENLM